MSNSSFIIISFLLFFVWVLSYWYISQDKIPDFSRWDRVICYWDDLLGRKYLDEVWIERVSKNYIIDIYWSIYESKDCELLKKCDTIRYDTRIGWWADTWDVIWFTCTWNIIK